MNKEEFVRNIGNLEHYCRTLRFGDDCRHISEFPAEVAKHDKQLSIEIQAWVSAGEIVAKSIRSRMESK